MKRTSSNRFPAFSLAMAFAGLVLLAGGVSTAFGQDDPQATASEAPEVEAAPAPAAPATTLERIRATGNLRLGYRSDARPFSYRDESNRPAGYVVSLCETVVDAIGRSAGRSIRTEWMEVSAAGSVDAVTNGDVDLLCGATSETLERREQVSFSIAVFPGGIGALMRSDAPDRLRLVLEGRPVPSTPLWRGTPAHVLQHRVFSAVSGTTSEAWLNERIATFRILSEVSPVDSYEAGVERVLDRRSDVMFGDRAILLAAAASSHGADDLMVLDRLFTLEPVALAMARGDEELRLVVDRALSELYGTPEFGELYTGFFGEPDERVLLFYRISALPE